MLTAVGEMPLGRNRQKSLLPPSLVLSLCLAGRLNLPEKAASGPVSGTRTPPFGILHRAISVAAGELGTRESILTVIAASAELISRDYELLSI